MDDVTGSCFSLFCLTWCAVLKCLQDYSGLLIFRGKKSKISQDFQGQIRGKIGRFRGKKVKIRGKIGRFRGIFAEKSQISKDFQRQILRKIGRFHGKFRGGGEPRHATISKKQPISLDFGGEILLKSINFASI